MLSNKMMYTTDTDSKILSSGLYETEDIMRMQKLLIRHEKELTSQRKTLLRREAMLHALCRDYMNVYYIDLNADIYEPYRLDPMMPSDVRSIVDTSGNYDQLRKLYINKFVHPEDRAALTEHIASENIRAELRINNSISYYYRVIRDDRDVYMQMKFVRLRADLDNGELILGIRNVDYAYRKDFEKTLLLSDALKQAEYANRSKTTFLNNMSHDIRTPMNAIIGFTEIAKKHIDEPERVMDCLVKISGASAHLLSLINDVLDMSRIESGKTQIDEGPENLSEILDNLKGLIQADIKKRGHEFLIYTADLSHDEICCDRLRLNQVLINLLSNAIKYTPDGGEISLAVKELPSEIKDHATYEFRIKDNGLGMSPEFAAHIFEPFTRESTSTISGIQGTGLGMSITKTLVDMMGGTIELDTTEGVGSEFIVTLSLKLQTICSCNDNKLKKEKVSGEANALSSLKGLKILLAEDNELNTEIAVDILTEAGCTVETVENGLIAARKVHHSEPGTYDLVLMDIQMPVMDGYTAARRIRKYRNKELSTIPIIAMTANAFAEDRQKALESGMDAHIAKPIDVNVLFDTIKKIIK